ncbi:AAA domain-containing protein [Mucilaginibacter robiniae]|uniref:AAA domain-containing protein n=2 Tax=Mucilaginibacter robiniae TaxID=2728022 RepID=A0A7L5E6N2_9SPHI|nr:AAA domain-containing protein [Mucilaginibacter robiniae]
MNSLPVPDFANLALTVAKISEVGLPAYLEAIDKLKRWFPGCRLYEINLLNWLINTSEPDKLMVEKKYAVISSYADGQESNDQFDDFVAENAVWTGGPESRNGHKVYPLGKFDRGDIVLVRRGTVRLGGIGIILRNGYLLSGWDEDKNIQILWLIRQNRKISDTKLGQWDGFVEATAKTLACFRDVYPETFQIIDQIRQKQRKIMNHRLNKQKNIILSGPPGTGKTRKALQIAQWLTNDGDKTVSLLQAIDGRIIPNTDPSIEQIPEAELIQFHPSYTYEDFVRGIVTVTEQEKLIYRVENRTLAKMAMEAAKPENSDKPYVLIIDEINRANLSSVLGELIYALEYRGKTVDTLYAYEGDTGLNLPENLYIIGTMNTADRSIGHIDYAIRRRFAFIPVPPEVTAISTNVGRKLYDGVQALFDHHTSPEFDPADVRIGHSYFLGEETGLAMRLKYEIKPILLEYVRDGILLEPAKPLIENLHV